MDFSTIKLKLAASEVKDFQHFVKLVRLVFSNATTFNAPDSQVHQDALAMSTLFEKELLPPSTANTTTPQTEVQTEVPLPPSKIKSEPSSRPSTPQPANKPVEKTKLKPFQTAAPERPKQDETMTVASLNGKKCRRILRKLQGDRHGTVFLTPVDPIALGIPQYSEIIKNPMDLSTIERKLNNGQYKGPDGFRADIELMLENCFTFNHPGECLCDLLHYVQKIS
jgi:hypothetical protein